jgi:hypothetical protein
MPLSGPTERAPSDRARNNTCRGRRPLQGARLLCQGNLPGDAGAFYPRTAAPLRSAPVPLRSGPVPLRAKSATVCRKRETEGSDRRTFGTNRRANCQKRRASAPSGLQFGVAGRRFDPTWEHLLEPGEQIRKKGEHPGRSGERRRRTGTVMPLPSAAALRSGPASQRRIRFVPSICAAPQHRNTQRLKMIGADAHMFDAALDSTELFPILERQNPACGTAAEARRFLFARNSQAASGL